LKRHPLIAFFVIAFGITWGIGGLFFAFSSQLIAFFGPLDLTRPFYRIVWHVAVYAPPISAFTVIALTKGADGIRAYLRRLLHWRVGIQWYLLVLVGVPALYACSRAIFFAVHGTGPAYPFDPWYLVIPSALFALVKDPGPMEELGWRGFALPLLQQRFNALASSIILGVIWGLWHLPAFYISALPQSPLSFPIFLLEVVSLSILMTAAYNSTGGSIPLAFLIHWQLNNAFGLGIFPDGLLISGILLTVAAVIFIIVLGPRCLGPTKYTEPIPPIQQREAISTTAASA